MGAGRDLPEGYTLRALRPGDLSGLLALYRHLHPTDPWLTEEPRVERIWMALLDNPLQIYLGVFIGQTLVAACNAAIIENLTRGARPYALIENVVTDPAHRRLGLARVALDALAERCWAHDCYKVMLMSAAQRNSAHALYEAIGFDPLAKQAFVLKPSGRS